AEDGIRDLTVTGVQTCALPIFRRALEVLGVAELLLAGRDELAHVLHLHVDALDRGGPLRLLLLLRALPRVAREREAEHDQEHERSEERRVGKGGGAGGEEGQRE